MSRQFEVYFSVGEVAARLGKSQRTIKRWAEKGDLGTVWRLGGELMMAESSLLVFLDRHIEDFSGVAREIRRKAFERQLGRPPGRGPFPPGIAARTEGELRRKMSEKQGGDCCEIKKES